MIGTRRMLLRVLLIYIYISILRRVQSSFSGALDCSTFPLEFLLFAVFILPIESGRME